MLRISRTAPSSSFTSRAALSRRSIFAFSVTFAFSENSAFDAASTIHVERQLKYGIDNAAMTLCHGDVEHGDNVTAGGGSSP